MLSFLLFLTAFVAVLGIIAFFVGAESLLDPFGRRNQKIGGFALLLFFVPLLFTFAFNINTIRQNYCPALEPIAAPDLAEEQIILPVQVVTKQLKVIKEIPAAQPAPAAEPARKCNGPRCSRGG